MPASLTHLAADAVLWAAKDPVPADKDVKAGWLALIVVVALVVAVVLLLISMNRHLRKVRRNAEAGNVFDPSDPDDRRPEIPIQ